MDPVKQVTFNLNTAKNGYIITIYHDDEDGGNNWVQGGSHQFIATTVEEVKELLAKALS